MPIFNNQLAGAAGSAGGAGDFKIERSLRFNPGDTSYLTKTFSSAGNRKTYTFSCWVKIGSIGAEKNLLYADNAWFRFESTDHIYFWHSGGNIYTDAKFRDPSAWYHVIFAVDTTQATASNRVKIYVNGVNQALSGSYPNQDAVGGHNTANAHNIGRQHTNSNLFNGYMADVHFVDGQALAATDFGEFDATTGAWNPKAYSGTYGNNGFHLDFSDNSSDAALGTDSSGNSNTWTVTNINATAPLNSGPFSAANAYTGTTNNNYGVSDGSWNSAFDGNTGNGVYVANSNGESILTMVNSASWSSSIRIRSQYMSGQNDGWVKLNNTTFNPAGSSSQWTDVTSTMGNSGTLTSVGVRNYARLFAIELDGEILTDSASPGRVDSLLDSPTNYEASSGNNGGNYATLNPLSGDLTLTNGNLDSSSNYAAWKGNPATFAVSSGKWYFESTVLSTNSGNVYADWGIVTTSNATFTGQTVGDYGISYYGRLGRKEKNNTSAITSSSGVTSGDVVQVAFDLDVGKIWFGVNNTWIDSGNPSAGSNEAYTVESDTWVPAVAMFDDGTVATNFGQRPFVYTPPTGFKSLCTQNLDDPLIVDGSTAFDVVTYSGSGYSNTTNPSQSITGLSFSPDLVWAKAKSATYSHGLFDSVRGPNKQLRTNGTNTETNDSGTSSSLVSFDSNGFTLGPDAGAGSINYGGTNYVAWAWDGGDLVANSAYNQSQEWSSGTSSNPTQGSWANVFASSFSSSWADGTDAWVYNASATLNFSPALPAGAIEVYATASGASATDCYVSFSDGTNTYTTGNLSGVNHAWVDVASGSSLSGITSVTINSGPSSSEGLSLKAIKVAGKELVDAGVIPAGTENSSVYNQDQVWSTYGTFTGSYVNNYDWEGVFSNVNTYNDAGSMYVNPAPAKWVLTSPLACSSEFKFYCYGNTSITLNEGRNDEVTVTSTGGNSFHYGTISFSGDIYSVKLNTQQVYLIRLFVDGKALIDNGVSVDNVPSIASTVRANPTAGFSIVKYTGDGGSSATIAHGLNATPEMIMVKNRDQTDEGRVYHAKTDTAAPEQYYLNLFSSSGSDQRNDAGAVWNDTKPNHGVFSVGTEDNVNANDENYIAYCWTSVEGYSAFGSYTGNASPNGPFVYTGFRPAFILAKGITDAEDWYIRDTARSPSNEVDESLRPNDAGSEYSGRTIDILSNGFKITDSDSQINEWGKSYLYACFAENPFKTARAR